MKNDTVDVRQKLTERALNLLSYRPQSIAEFKTKLNRSSADPAIITAVTLNLIERGLLDDLKFSRWWVEQRVKFRPRGNIALRFELNQKGVAKDIIDSVLLSREEELELAKKIPAAKRQARGFSFSVLNKFRNI